MKVTFLKDTGPIAITGWEFYRKGTKATLSGGAELVAGGYAREGWESALVVALKKKPPVVAPEVPETKPRSFIENVKATLKFKAEPNLPVT